MPYIICNGNNFLQQDDQCRFKIVHSIDECTKWNNIVKANNVVKINGSILCRRYKLKVQYISKENHGYNHVAKPIELDYEILDKVKEISVFTQNVEERRLYLMDMIHKVDLEIVDIEHAAEFYQLNAAQGYKIYKMLHNARVDRRKYKDELKKINLYLGTSIRSTSMKHLENSIIGIDNQQYTPRVNNELFGV